MLYRNFICLGEINMEFIGWGLLLLILPFTIISVMLSVIVPFISNSLKTVKKETKEKLENEQKKIFNEISEKDNSISEEEKQAYCKRIGDILKKGRKKVRHAVDEEFGFDDMKKGNKEIMDELKTEDISGIFKFKDIFK